MLATIKETPNEAELISHQLMLRAGMIRQLNVGLYSWLPLGLKVLHKVEQIVREEMNNSGALEILMPMVQPAELWQETGRWHDYGPLLLKAKDRHKREYCLGPTHEEVITELTRHELKSYKQLPVNLYQIQTKFRDEIRPRFGVMRAREFIMKDAYSFHLDQQSLEQTYQQMCEAYCRIFDRIGLEYRVVAAASGEIGGQKSSEFQVLADSGEDIVVISDKSSYAANIELAQALAPTTKTNTSKQEMMLFDTPKARTIKDLADNFGIPAECSVKTLIVHGSEHSLVALILRGDHQLNPLKAQNLTEVSHPLQFASEDEIIKAFGCGPGSLGPVTMEIPIIVDRDAACLTDFCCGANQQDKHYKHVNWQRDVQYYSVADLRNVVEGDLSPDGKGQLKFHRGIEVGHIFQLGDKYSKSMNATILNEQGDTTHMAMGCYGLGITRVVAATIEQNHDDNGIIWPNAIAPFQIALIPINMRRSQKLRERAQQLYQQLVDASFEVLFDDRNERPGRMFADCDLIGIPHRIVISEKGLDAGIIEYKKRDAAKPIDIKISNIFEFLRAELPRRQG